MLECIQYGPLSWVVVCPSGEMTATHWSTVWQCARGSKPRRAASRRACAACPYLCSLVIVGRITAHISLTHRFLSAKYVHIYMFCHAIFPNLGRRWEHNGRLKNSPSLARAEDDVWGRQGCGWEDALVRTLYSSLWVSPRVDSARAKMGHLDARRNLFSRVSFVFGPVHFVSSRCYTF